MGRVQTATLAILVDHELEILKHEPTPFWVLTAQFEGTDSSWNGRWEGGESTDDTKPHWILTLQDKERIQTLIDSGEKAVVTEKVTTSKERPPLNFDLTTLQRQANSMFSWPAKRTLNVAQSLYERHKLTTYPRTDSRFLPTDMKDTINATLSNLGELDDMSEYIQNLTNNGLQNVSRNFNDAKVSDHFAIIPTGNLPTQALSKDEQRLYNMIVRNFIASWYGESVIEKQKRTANLGGEIFNKEAQQYTVHGWREVVPKNLSHPEGWGTISVDNPHASISSHEWSEEKSKPPTRIKEARLLSLMEKAEGTSKTRIWQKQWQEKASEHQQHVQIRSKNYYPEVTFLANNRVLSMLHRMAFESSKFCDEFQLNGLLQPSLLAKWKRLSQPSRKER